MGFVRENTDVERVACQRLWWWQKQQYILNYFQSKFNEKYIMDLDVSHARESQVKTRVRLVGGAI